MSRESVLEEIIEGYRNTINIRYQYDYLQEIVEIPMSIVESDIDKIRNYFLDFIYPEYKKRKELNEAFDSLDSYIKSPEKLLNILMTSMKLIFSHGSHLPKILNTGLKALKSFRAGTQFENKLVDQAIQNDIQGPYDPDKVNRLISTLPPKDIERFIAHSQSLIEVFHDQKLINKIEEILSFLIEKMKDNTKLYSENDVKGLKLGYEMLKEGNELFKSFGSENQHFIINLIIDLERNHLNEIFNNYSTGN